MTDKFILTVGQAHELQHAFHRHGWTVAEVQQLCRGDTLGLVRTQMFVPFLEKSARHFFTEERLEKAGVPKTQCRRLMGALWNNKDYGTLGEFIEYFKLVLKRRRIIIGVGPKSYPYILKCLEEVGITL